MKRKKILTQKKINMKFKILVSALSLFILAFLLSLFLNGLLNNEPNKVPEASPDEQRINLLVTGLDKDGIRTDMILIISYDTANNQIDILPIPENTRMYVGGRYQKISAAHAITKDGKQKGISGTIEALYRLTGIPFNYYIEFTEESFIDFIDALGGVEFTIPKNMKYRDPLGDIYINLKKGHGVLDGDKALQLIRYVSYQEGAQMRTMIQTDFLKALAVQKFTPEYIKVLPELYKTMNISTNIGPLDTIKYSNIMLNINSTNIIFHSLPGNQETLSVTYWIPDMERVKVMITEVFGYNSENLTIDKTKKL